MKRSNEELIVLARNGDKQAQYEFFEFNQGLAYHVAQKFLSTYPSLEDLMGYANIGLVKAFKTFHTEQGAKFASYAVIVMENEIRMFLRKERRRIKTVHLETPVNAWEDGKILTIKDVYPVPESESTKDVLISFEQFCSFLSERDRQIAYRTIIENENQMKVAKDFGLSQSYVSRITKWIKRRFKIYLETGRLPVKGRKSA